jgi:hypothetical protein
MAAEPSLPARQHGIVLLLAEQRWSYTSSRSPEACCMRRIRHQGHSGGVCGSKEVRRSKTSSSALTLTSNSRRARAPSDASV